MLHGRYTRGRPYSDSQASIVGYETLENGIRDSPWIRSEEVSHVSGLDKGHQVGVQPGGDLYLAGREATGGGAPEWLAP